jgi:membrane complex biogenesis BtpA family protein
VLLKDIFRTAHPVIAALHLPPFRGAGDPDAADIDWIEDYAVENAGLFAAGGVDGLFIQDQTTPIDAAGFPNVVANLSVAARAVRRAHPQLPIGIIVNHHGAATALAVARAVGASFVRLKVYVGAMMKPGGIEQGCAFEALAYRTQLQAENIAIFADVFDRTGTPVGPTTLEEASHWAARRGRADALVLTGHSFADSLAMLDRVRARQLGVPLLLGGSVTTDQVGTAFDHADGVIVSSALMRKDGSLQQRRSRPWDEQEIRRFMEVATTHRKAEATR